MTYQYTPWFSVTNKASINGLDLTLSFGSENTFDIEIHVGILPLAALVVPQLIPEIVKEGVPAAIQAVTTAVASAVQVVGNAISMGWNKLAGVFRR